MDPLERIEGPKLPAYSFIESRRTKLVGPMTVAELTAACGVLEFDRWLFDDSYRGKFVRRCAWLKLGQDSNGYYSVYDLVIHDEAYEALLRISDSEGSLRTARGENKSYKLVETLISDVYKALDSSANPNDKYGIDIKFAISFPKSVSNDASEN